MTKQFRLKTILALLFAGIMLICGSMIIANVSAQESGNAVATLETFSMETGASVRLVEDASGIRFKASITKGDYDGILTAYPATDGYTYRVYTKVVPENKAGATPKVIEHAKGFVFEEGATETSVATVNAAIVYDNLPDNLKEQAYKTLLNAQTFIEVVKENNVVKTYEAIVPEGNARSMRAVANADKVAGNNNEMLDAYLGDFTIEDSGAKINTFMDNGSVTLPAGVTPETVVIGAEQVEFTVDNGNSLINFAYSKDYTGTKYVAVFDANGNVYNYMADVENCAYVTAQNYKSETYGLYAAINANVDIVLQDNLDMTGMANTVADGNYTKTFDGNGKTISNLASTENSIGGGLVSYFGGTLKNLVITGAILGDSGSDNVGIIAYGNNYKDVTIENVFIEVATVNVNQAGLFQRVQQNSTTGKITATNLVIKYPETITRTTTGYFGYLCSFGTANASGNGQFLLNNCYFYNGGENTVDLFMTRDGWATTLDANSTYTVYNNGDARMSAYKVNKAGKFTATHLSTAIANQYAGFEVVEINQDNVSDATSGLYVSINASKNILITSDLDMTGITPTASGTYSAVFDGGEHAISNILAVAGIGGLFNILNGKVSNVALTNVSLGTTETSNGIGNTFGAVAIQLNSSDVVMSNIYVEITFAKGGFIGGLACYGAYGCKVKDAIIVMPALTDISYNTGSSGGAPGAICGYVFAGSRVKIDINNAYIVGCGGNITGARKNNQNYKDTVNQMIVSGSKYKTYNAVSNLTADATKTLTPFLAKCLNAKNA